MMIYKMSLFEICPFVQDMYISSVCDIKPNGRSPQKAVANYAD